MKTLVLLLTLACAFTIPAVAAGKKAPKSTLSFHLEGNRGDGPKMVFPQMTAGKTRYFRFTPEITHKNIVAFTSFPSEIDDYGLVLKLDRVGSRRLSTVANSQQGQWLIAQVNGRVVDGVIIDKFRNDGCIVIWKGISAPEIHALEMMLPRIGEDKKAWKKRIKKLKKQKAQ